MSESLGFMFFSTIEAVGFYALIMSMFRLRMGDYIWQALVVILLSNLQSFILRNELSMAEIAPLISIAIFVLLFVTIVKIPLVWSIFCTVLGFAVLLFVQSMCIKLLFDSIQDAQASMSGAYAIQTFSGLVLLGVSWLMFKTGIGFSFDFNRLRIKFEDIIIVILIILFFSSVSFIFYYNQIWINLFFFAATTGIFLYFAFRKESQID